MKQMWIAIGGALACSGCAALPFSGLALEGYAGASRMTPSDNDAMTEAEQGLGVQLGVALSVEVDYVRSSGMGMGYSYVTSTLPREGEASSLGLGVSQYDVSSAFTEIGSDNVRGRIYFGLQYARNSYDDLLMGSFLGGGASWHPAKGYAVHVFTGPQAMLIENNQEELNYGAVGWFARVRLYRAFFKSCDVPPSKAAERAGRGPVECD